jgi:hypothetical protein
MATSSYPFYNADIKRFLSASPASLRLCVYKVVGVLGKEHLTGRLLLHIPFTTQRRGGAGDAERREKREF